MKSRLTLGTLKRVTNGKRQTTVLNTLSHLRHSGLYHQLLILNCRHVCYFFVTRERRPIEHDLNSDDGSIPDKGLRTNPENLWNFYIYLSNTLNKKYPHKLDNHT